MSGYSSNHKEKVKKDIKKKIKKKVKKNKSNEKYIGSGSPVVKYKAGYGKSAAPIAYAAPPQSHDFHLRSKQLIDLMNSNQQITAQTYAWQNKAQQEIARQEALTRKKNEYENIYNEQLQQANKAEKEMREAEHNYNMAQMEAQHKAAMREIKLKQARAENELKMLQELNNATERMEDDLLANKFKIEREAKRHEITIKKKQAGLDGPEGKTHADQLQELQKEEFELEQQIKDAENDQNLAKIRHEVELKRIEGEKIKKRNDQQDAMYKQLETITRGKSEAEVKENYFKLSQDLLDQAAKAEKQGQNAEAEKYRTMSRWLYNQHDVAYNAFKHEGNMAHIGVPLFATVHGEPLGTRGDNAMPGERVSFQTAFQARQASVDNPKASEQDMEEIKNIHTKFTELGNQNGSWGSNPKTYEEFVEDVNRTADYMKGTFNATEHTLKKAGESLREVQEQNNKIRSMLTEAAVRVNKLHPINYHGKEFTSQEQIEESIKRSTPAEWQSLAETVNGILDKFKTEAPEFQSQLEKELASLSNVEGMNADIIQKQKSIAGLKDHHQQLEEQINTINSEMTGLDALIKERTEHLGTLQKELRERQVQLDRLNETNSRKEEEGKSQQAKIDEATRNKEKAARNFANEAETVKLLREQTESLNKLLKEEKATGRKLQDEHEAKKKDLDEVSERVGRYRTVNETLQNDIKAAGEEIDRIQTENEKLQQHLKAKRKEVDDAKTAKYGYETTLGDLESQHAEHIRTNREWKQRLAAKRKEVEEAGMEKYGYETQLGELESQYAEHIQANREWEQRVAAGRQEVEGKKAVRDGYETEYRNLQGQYNEHDRRVRELEAEISRITSETETKKREIEDLTHRRNLVAQEQQQVANQRWHAENIVNELGEKVAEGATAVRQLANHIPELQHNLGEIHRTYQAISTRAQGIVEQTRQSQATMDQAAGFVRNAVATISPQAAARLSNASSAQVLNFGVENVGRIISGMGQTIQQLRGDPTQGAIAGQPQQMIPYQGQQPIVQEVP